MTGTVADGSPISELIDSYRRLTSADIPDGLYVALTEALTNVRQHAYPPDSPIPPHLRRWWLFSKYEEPEGGREGSLYVGVYDIGIGIQTSMRRRMKPGEKLLDAAGNLLEMAGKSTSLVDRVLLAAAVERLRSSTGEAFRGNGLPEMRDFVLRTTSGRLSIVAGQSQHTSMAKNPRASAYESQRMFGTLIVWSIPLQPKEKPK